MNSIIEPFFFTALKYETDYNIIIRLLIDIVNHGYNYAYEMREDNFSTTIIFYTNRQTFLMIQKEYSDKLKLIRHLMTEYINK